MANIRDILIISTPEDTPRFESLLGDGHQFGIKLSYAVQPSPDGLAQAFIIGEEFIGDDACAMILGDNIFYGNGLGNMLKSAAKRADEGRASVFGFYVNDPERFGVVEFDENYKALSLEEKPANPKSNYAVTGLYFYPSGVSEMAKQVKPSARGELEITSVNEWYLKQGELSVQLMGRGMAWLDTGTHEDLIKASMFIEALESRQGLKIACLEAIAYKNGWIDEAHLKARAMLMKNTGYGQYLLDIVENKNNDFF